MVITGSQEARAIWLSTPVGYHHPGPLYRQSDQDRYPDQSPARYGPHLADDSLVHDLTILRLNTANIEEFCGDSRVGERTGHTPCDDVSPVQQARIRTRGATDSAPCHCRQVARRKGSATTVGSSAVQARIGREIVSVLIICKCHLVGLVSRMVEIKVLISAGQ